jgi:hypothetical protein
MFFLGFSESGCQMTVSGAIFALPERQNIMRPIDIDALSEDELIELNHKVVARLRFLSQMRSHSAMLDFRVGERVKFHPDGGPELQVCSPEPIRPARRPPAQTIPASRASQIALLKRRSADPTRQTDCGEK